MKTIYEEAVEKGWPIDSHESDLYLLYTAETVEAVKRHGHGFKAFRGNDGQTWIEVPFMYDPFWAARTREVEKD